MSKKGKFLAFDMGAASGRGLVGILDDGLLKLQEIHRFENGPVQVFDTIYWDILKMLEELKRAMEICAQEYGPDLDGMGVDT